MGGAEVVGFLNNSFSFICSLKFVTFSVSCFRSCFQGWWLWAFWRGWVFGGLFLVVSCSMNQYLGICLLFLKHSWFCKKAGYFLYCVAVFSCNNSFLLSFPSKWVAGWFPTQIQCVHREALIISTLDLCLCQLHTLPAAVSDIQHCEGIGLLRTHLPTCREIIHLQVQL